MKIQLAVIGLVLSCCRQQLTNKQNKMKKTNKSPPTPQDANMAIRKVCRDEERLANVPQFRPRRSLFVVFCPAACLGAVSRVRR